MARIGVAVSGTVFLFAATYILGHTIERFGIDKIFHIAMGVFLALFFSTFLRGAFLVGGIVLGIGCAWEVFQLYMEWSPRITLWYILGDPLFDMLADMAGFTLYWRWIAPHI